MPRPFRYNFIFVSLIKTVSHRRLSVWLGIPMVFCIIAAGLVVATIIQQPAPSGIAIGCIAAGIPVCCVLSCHMNTDAVCLQFYFLEGHIHKFAVRTFCPSLMHLYRHHNNHHHHAVPTTDISESTSEAEHML